MFAQNEAVADRIIRVVLGIVLLALSFGSVVVGGWGLAMKIVGVLALLTGIIGWCPAYTLLGLSTRKQMKTVPIKDK